MPFTAREALRREVDMKEQLLVNSEAQRVPRIANPDHWEGDRK